MQLHHGAGLYGRVSTDEGVDARLSRDGAIAEAHGHLLREAKAVGRDLYHRPQAHRRSDAAGEARTMTLCRGERTRRIHRVPFNLHPNEEQSLFLL
jgi:hypothetical protein